MLDVGRVTKPHGLHGQVVVELWTNRAERLSPGAELSTGSQKLSVMAATPLPDAGGRSRWLVTFAGVTGRDQAEALRDAVLQAPPMEVEGALWVHEMVGASLFDPSGEVVGRIDAVEANPASDLLLLEDGRAVPLTFVTRGTDGRLVVDGPAGLLDL